MKYGKRRPIRLPTVTLHHNRRMCIYIIEAQMILKLWHDLMVEIYICFGLMVCLCLSQILRIWTPISTQYSSGFWSINNIAACVTVLLTFWRANIILLRLTIRNYSCTSCTPSNSYFNTLNTALLNWCCPDSVYVAHCIRRKHSHYRIKIGCLLEVV